MRCKKALLESLLVETDHKLLIATAKRGLASILLGNNIFFFSYKYKNCKPDASLSESLEADRLSRAPGKKCSGIKSGGRLFTSCKFIEKPV